MVAMMAVERQAVKVPRGLEWIRSSVQFADHSVTALKRHLDGNYGVSVQGWILIPSGVFAIYLLHLGSLHSSVEPPLTMCDMPAVAVATWPALGLCPRRRVHGE